MYLIHVDAFNVAGIEAYYLAFNISGKKSNSR